MVALGAGTGGLEVGTAERPVGAGIVPQAARSTVVRSHARRFTPERLTTCGLSQPPFGESRYRYEENEQESRATEPADEIRPGDIALAAANDVVAVTFRYRRSPRSERKFEQLRALGIHQSQMKAGSPAEGRPDSDVEARAP